ASDHRRGIGNALLEYPASRLVVAFKIRYLIASVVDVAIHETKRLAGQYPVVGTDGGAGPVRRTVDVIHSSKGNNGIPVERDVCRYVESEVASVEHDVVQGHFDPFIFGFAHVPELIVITGTRCRETDQEIACTVFIRFNGTSQSSAEEVEVDTDIPCHSGLPLQVRVSHCFGSRPEAVESINPGRGVGYERLHGLSRRNIVIPRFT